MAAEQVTLTARALSAEDFMPYGDVIEPVSSHCQDMNSARFERFTDLANVDIDADRGGRPAISIARCRVASCLPHRVDLLERHPLGSQAFIPLGGFRFLVVVAAAGELAAEAPVHAFITNGQQGVNYRRGTWHMPMIGLESGQQFLIVDRAGEGNNCEERKLAGSLWVDL